MRIGIGKPVARMAIEATRQLQLLSRGKRQTSRSAALPVLGALGAGALLMYFLDPSRGNRRRKLLADKVVHAGHTFGDAAGKTARDLRNRATGVVSTARQRRMNETVDDQVLVERVRAALGHVVSHPGAIQVTAQDGVVALAGPVLRTEADRLVQRVGKVRGVSDVEDLLEIRDSMDAGLSGVITTVETHVPPGDAATLS